MKRTHVPKQTYKQYPQAKRVKQFKIDTYPIGFEASLKISKYLVCKQHHKAAIYNLWQ